MRKLHTPTMDLQYFFNVLWKRKWLLVTVGLIAAITTFFIVGMLPHKFKAQATIEARLIEADMINPLNNNPFIQQFQADAMFSELIAQMTSRRILKLLSEELLYHDLAADGVNEEPFRTPKLKGDTQYSRAEIEDFMTVLASMKDTVAATRMEKHNRVTYNELAEAFGYDIESLYEDLEVKRVKESGYVNVTFTSEHPALSYFAVQKLCDEFLTYFDTEILNDEDATVRKFRIELKAKKAIFDKKTTELNKYREENNIVDIEKQSSTVIDEISELSTLIERERQEVKKQSKKLQTTKREIDRIAPDMNKGVAKKRYLNEELEKIQSQIKKLNNDFVSGGRKDLQLAETLANLRKRREDIGKQMALYAASNDRLENNRLEKLLNDKTEAEIDLKSAEESLIGYEAQKKRLVGDQQSMLEDDAGFKQLNSEWLLAYEEFKDAKAKFDQAELRAGVQESPLVLFEEAEIPEKAEPKNRALLSAFAGTAAGMLTTLLVFLLAFFDRSYSNSYQFKKISGLPLMGTINKLKAKELDLYAIFNTPTNDSKIELFKESIRKLRFSIEMSDARTYLFASAKPQEGKSFLLLTLAYALSLNNRRVLLIDANFKNNSLSAMSNVSVDDNPLLNGKPATEGTDVGTQNLRMTGVDIMGNAGDSRSASEVLGGKDLRAILRNYELDYDYVFIEAAAMNDYSDARELSQFVDKVVLISSAESKLNNEDKESFTFLRSLGSRFFGSVLNKLVEK